MREAIKVPCEPKTASAKAMWIAKAVDISLDSASCEAKIVSDCKTILALHRSKPCLSRKAKIKVLCTNNEATVAPLTLSTLVGSARLAASGKTKAISAQIVSSCESNSTLCRVQLAYHARLRLKHLCVLITLQIQHRSYCQHLVLKFLAARLELKRLLLRILAARLNMKHH